MWNTITEIVRHIRNAHRKHPSFPTRIISAKTTRRAMTQKCNHWKSLNDKGCETINSVLQEEVSELMYEMTGRDGG